MFKAAPNPYDDIVVKATDENQTSENWEVILNLCDKVQDEGESGARNVVAAILKRLAHRTSNVQLYSLALAEALSKNCDVELHRELASRSFTQGLEKLITDRNTHDKVKKRALGLIATWTAEFEDDPTLGIMEECYENLKSKNYKFEHVTEPPPPEADDEIRRKEEEELQKVLELSIQDKGGRGTWSNGYSSGGAGGSSSAAGGSKAGASSSKTTIPGAYPSGYTPSPNPATAAMTAPSSSRHANKPAAAPAPAPVIQAVPALAAAPAPAVVASPVSPAPGTGTPATVSRVRALHTFEATEQGELAFEKGDIIKVVDRTYQDWWRGQLRGRSGIFPVNYVEPVPDPTPAEVAREAQQEAQVFAQAAAIDQLLDMLRKVDPLKDNLADNEEIQELYRSSMTLRPKIVKLIDRYSQKRADLVHMNESFVKARRIFDQMMEESLAKHNPGAAVYDYTRQEAPAPRAPVPGDYRGAGYGWNPAIYGPQQQQQTPQGPQQPAYGGPQYESGPGQYPPQDPAQQYVQPYGPDPYHQQPQQPPQQQQPGAAQQGPYGMDPNVYQQQLQQQQLQQFQQAQQAVQQGQQQAQLAQQAAQQAQQQAQLQVQQQLQAQQQQQQQQQQPQETVPEQQQAYQQPVQGQPAQGVQPQPIAEQGPPYIFDPNRQYADPNVLAWAQYYAGGGTDPSGRVYFTPESLPLSDGVSPGATQPQQAVQEQQPQQAQQVVYGQLQQSQLSQSPVSSLHHHQQVDPAQQQPLQQQQQQVPGSTSPQAVHTFAQAQQTPAQAYTGAPTSPGGGYHNPAVDPINARPLSPTQRPMSVAAATGYNPASGAYMGSPPPDGGNPHGGFAGLQQGFAGIQLGGPGSPHGQQGIQPVPGV